MEIKKLNFITNIPLSEVSGGWSGISYRIFKQLEKYYEVNYIGPINPKSYFLEKSISKVLRLMGLKGAFHFYSKKRLRKIHSMVELQLGDADYNFFFGATPWIYCDFDTPFGLYMDAAFTTYMDIYSNKNLFVTKDLIRIQKNEEAWLKNARHIFMGSQWAWDQMADSYDLDEKKKVLLWVGGNIKIPERDNYDGGKNLVFISLDFEKKGGYTAIEVLKILRKSNPDFTLTIIGQKPPAHIISSDGVSYAGLLSKHKPEEYDRFVSILQEAFFLIHPTKMDTMGAVIIEAGYFGCPAIATNAFGIPELIADGFSGGLIKDSHTIEDIVNKLDGLSKNQGNYLAMRRNVRGYALENFTYEKIGEKIRDKLSE